MLCIYARSVLGGCHISVSLLIQFTRNVVLHLLYARLSKYLVHEITRSGTRPISSTPHIAPTKDFDMIQFACASPNIKAT